MGHVSGITDLSFSADNTMLASSSYDGTARLWDCAHPDRQPVVLTDHDGWVYSVSLTADGTRLVSAGADKTIRARFTGMEPLVNAICKRSTRNLSNDEWKKYVGEDIDYQEACPAAQR